MQKRNFYIYQEDLIKYEIKEESVTISKLVEDLNNRYCEDDMRKLRTEIITDFLLRKGYLYRDEDMHKRPSLKGKILGIKIENIFREKGNKYVVNVYNARAQRYIIDHIYDILQMKS